MSVRALFTATILLSAFLLLLIQPMLSKIILPKLGGSPAVWQTAMMFYQTLLLGGYVYAHAASQMLGARRQSLLHGGLLLVSAISLPISLYLTPMFEPTAQPVMFLLLSLLVTIGLPFFVLAANAPLIQHWYSCHSNTRGRDPYVLYSASNLGSFAALLSYPFLIEPWLTLSGQTATWSALYAVFGCLLIACIYQLRRHFAGEAPMDAPDAQALEEAKTPTWKQKLIWVALAFMPSSLMLGVTTHVTTDIAAVPLLWIVPLALYLLSFVLTFHPKMPGYLFFLKEQVIIIAILFIVMLTKLDLQMPFLFIHYLGFFAIAMVCHGQLSLNRPSTRFLTSFYVWISVGGALGGFFNAIIAPTIFTVAIEYMIVLFIACFLRPQTKEFSNERLQRLLDWLTPVGMVAILIGLYHIAPIFKQFFPEESKAVYTLFDTSFRGIIGNHTLLLIAALGMCLLLPKVCQHRPVRLALAVYVLVMSVPFTSAGTSSKVIHKERNFFGVSMVRKQESPPLHIYSHGTTLHGIQSLEQDKRLKLTSYYVQVRDIFNSLPDEVRLKPIAVAGLGAGTLACLGQENQQFDMFEIDTAVKHIAENTKFFTYLQDCPTQKTVIIQDARLGIEAVENGRYGVILMDAYSSDSLPMHLITREALATYIDKLAPGGVIGFHISNRYLKLDKILANLADDAGLFAIQRLARPQEANAVPSHWVIMARNKTDLATSNWEKEGWKELSPNGNEPWTDNYSNILEALR